MFSSYFKSIYRLQRQVINFSAVGAIGFSIEFLMIWILTLFLIPSPLSARAISFPFALLVTYYLNRKYTYKTRKPKTYKEFVTYSLISITGNVINLSSYTFFQMTFAQDSWLVHLIVATAISSFWNYYFYKKLFN